MARSKHHDRLVWPGVHISSVSVQSDGKIVVVAFMEIGRVQSLMGGGDAPLIPGRTRGWWRVQSVAVLYTVGTLCEVEIVAWAEASPHTYPR